MCHIYCVTSYNVKTKPLNLPQVAGCKTGHELLFLYFITQEMPKMKQSKYARVLSFYFMVTLMYACFGLHIKNVDLPFYSWLDSKGQINEHYWSWQL